MKVQLPRDSDRLVGSETLGGDGTSMIGCGSSLVVDKREREGGRQRERVGKREREEGGIEREREEGGIEREREKGRERGQGAKRAVYKERETWREIQREVGIEGSGGGGKEKRGDNQYIHCTNIYIKYY